MDRGQVERLPRELKALVIPLLDAYDSRIAELEHNDANNEKSLLAAQQTIRAMEASTLALTRENDQLRQQLENVFQESILGGGAADDPINFMSGPASSSFDRQETDAMSRLLQSENDVLQTQRHKMVREMQALKVHRNELRNQLQVAQQETASIKAASEHAREREDALAREISHVQINTQQVERKLHSLTEEHSSAMAEVSRLGAELRECQARSEEQRRIAEDSTSKLRIHENLVKKQKEDVTSLTVQVKQLQDMAQARAREYDAAKQHAAELTKAMSAYTQRALDVQEKDVELFNLREESKDMLDKAQMERDAVVSREQELQRKNVLLSEKHRASLAAATEQYEQQLMAFRDKQRTGQQQADAESNRLSLVCSELQQRVDRAERERKSAQEELERLSASQTAGAVHDRVNELATRLLAAERTRDELAHRLEDAEAAQEHTQVLMHRQHAQAQAAEAALEHRLAAALRTVDELQMETQRMGSQLQESVGAQRILERAAEAASSKHVQETASMKRDHDMQVKDISIKQSMLLEQACRAASQEGAQGCAEVWRRKLAAEVTRFEHTVRQLQQQNMHLSTRASTAKMTSSKADDGRRIAGEEVARLAGQLAAAERRAAAALARNQELIDAQEQTLCENRDLHSQLDAGELAVTRLRGHQ